jgi:hypothetical protein
MAQHSGRKMGKAGGKSIMKPVAVCGSAMPVFVAVMQNSFNTPFDAQGALYG